MTDFPGPLLPRDYTINIDPGDYGYLMGFIDQAAIVARTADERQYLDRIYAALEASSTRNREAS